MKRLFFIAAALVISSTISAQKDSLDAVIKVENEYNPVVVKANKQNFTPQIEIDNQEKPLDLLFSQKSSPYSQFVSEHKANDVLPQQAQQLPGYARIGYGNNNNADAMVGYTMDLNEKEKIRMLASFTGYNANRDGLANDWDSRFYTTWLSADYMHRFDNMSFGIEGNVNNKVFNYQQLQPTGTDKQNSSSYNIVLKAISHNAGPLSYKGNIGYTYNNRKYTHGQKESMSESHINANGTIVYELTDEYMYNIGINAAINGYIYNDALNLDGSKYKNLATIHINPFTNFRYNNWKIRLGIHLDMQTKGKAFLAVAPDVNIEGQINDVITLFASATGGRSHNTFTTIEHISPYWDNMGQYAPTYKIVDIMAGTRLTAEPIKSSLYIGYAYTKDDLFITYAGSTNLFNTFMQGTSRNIYAGGQIDYDYDGWLKASAKIRYDKWNSTDKEIILNYKPMLNIDVNAEARIIDGLYANAGYTFTRYTKENDIRIKNKNNFNAKIRYRCHEQIEAFIQGDNLFGSKYEIYPGYIAQGANVIVGASMSF